MNPHPELSRLRRHRFWEALVRGHVLSSLLLLVLLSVQGGKGLAAQPPQDTRPGQQQRAAGLRHHRGRRTDSHPLAVSIERPVVPAAIAEPSPSPPAPIWPASQPPRQAKVSWDRSSLAIEASNSSLEQILLVVAGVTGARLEGLAQDQRIFGNYGPGTVREVLLKLLTGCGYNVLMIGGRDADSPLEIVLSVSSPVGPQTAANHQPRSNSADDKADLPTESLRPPPLQTPFGNGDSGAPETPQQIMQDILERQPKIDQQQQNHPQQ